MLFNLVRGHVVANWKPISILIALQLTQALANLALPRLNGNIIDQGIVNSDIDYILSTGTVMLGVSFIQLIATIGAIYLAAKIAMSIGRDLRQQVFDKVQTFGAQELNRFGAPTLITRSTNDVQQVQMLLFMTFSFMIAAPIMGFGGIFMALSEDVKLSGLLVAVVPILLISIGLIIRKMRPLFKTQQVRLDAINRVLREQIMGIRVIRAFVKERVEEERFGKANSELQETAMAVSKLMAAMFPLVMLIMNGSVVAAIGFGAFRIESGAMGVGTLVAFQTYLIQILMAVMMATFMLMILPRAEVSAERINEVLDTETSIKMTAGAIKTELPAGRIAFEQVSFAYPGAEEAVLQDITFTAEPGEVTALVGSTGSGKTTLLNLIPRFFDPTAGRVLIDDHDISKLDPASVWATMGLVPQQALLFSGTVASNLRFGKSDATDAELYDALETAQARDFVDAMGGLDAEISQGGTNVSGGQRQRLAIARALVKKPKIYLFDDSFSALDFLTDVALRKALRQRTADSTFIVVAQRISTIRDAEKIVVLDEGRVVGVGRHDELFENCETYREIVLSQLTEDEAA